MHWCVRCLRNDLTQWSPSCWFWLSIISFPPSMFSCGCSSVTVALASPPSVDAPGRLLALALPFGFYGRKRRRWTFIVQRIQTNYFGSISTWFMICWTRFGFDIWRRLLICSLEKWKSCIEVSCSIIYPGIGSYRFVRGTLSWSCLACCGISVWSCTRCLKYPKGRTDRFFDSEVCEQERERSKRRRMRRMCTAHYRGKESECCWNQRKWSRYVSAAIEWKNLPNVEKFLIELEEESRWHKKKLQLHNFHENDYLIIR